VSDQLFGRDRETAVLHDVLHRACEGDGQVVVLEGEAGVGKSRLLAAVGEEASDAGVRVLSAGGLELERSFAFGLALRLFQPLLEGLEEQDRAELLSGPARVTQSWFEGRWPTEPVEGLDHAAALVHGLGYLATAVSHLPGRRPHVHARSREGAESGLLLLVDDAQWADTSTLRFIARLAAAVSTTPIACILGVRVGTPGASSAVLDQIRARATGLLKLAPLDARAAEAWVNADRPDASAGFVRACLQASGGNPFYLRELLSWARDAGLDPDDAAAEQLAELVPESVLRAVLMRVRELPSAAGTLASALAVLGDSTALSQGADLAGLDGRTAEDAADALVAAHILAPAQPLRFTHPLIQAALHADIPLAARSRAHRRAAELLRVGAFPPEMVGAHLIQARPDNDCRVVAHLRAAADRACALGEYAAGRRFLERALEEPPDEPTRSTIGVEIALIDAAVGAPGAVERVSEQLRQVRSACERSRVLHALARLLFARSDFEGAGRAIDQSLAELEAEQGSGIDTLAAEVVADQLAIAEVAPGLANRVGARRTELLSAATPGSLAGEPALLGLLASWLLVSGKPAEQVTSVAQMALAANWDNNRFYGMSTGHAAIALIAVDELDLAVDPIEHALRRAQESGSLIALGFTNHWLAVLRYCFGDLSGAVEAAQACLAVCRSGWNVCQPWVAPLLAHAFIDQGDLAAAAEALRLADAAPAQGGPDNPVQIEAAGRLALAGGRPADALEHYRAVQVLRARVDLDQPSPLPWRSGAALASAGLGEAAEATALALEEVRRTRPVGARRPLGVALRVAGLVIGGEAGLDHLSEAVQVLEQSPAALERARALIDLGSALRRAGQREESREPLRRGLGLADGFGARPLAARATNELRLAGGRRRRENPETVGLTSAEQRVVRFAAQGVSTPDIAQNLYLSPKTVEWHLANVYRKLGVRSRSELAAALN
jgi:DNA-binding CsgD family transcriptional regulator